MKLGTHIDLIEPNNFCTHVMGSAQQEVGYSGLFKKHMLWNLKYSSQDFQQMSTKLGECDLKTKETHTLAPDLNTGMTAGMDRVDVNAHLDDTG